VNYDNCSQQFTVTAKDSLMPVFGAHVQHVPVAYAAAILRACALIDPTSNTIARSTS
jgi:hypothetical protein